MIECFLEKLNIPESCYLGKSIFKKLFLENGQLDITDKKALKDDVDKIRWLYTLKPTTINITAYQDKQREFLEVEVLQVELTSNARTKRIAAFIHKTIPYPLLIIFSHGDQMALSVAEKRINQADKSKWLVEEVWLTEWINLNQPTSAENEFMAACAVKNLSFTNFYSFYEDIKSRVIALNAHCKKNGAHKGSFELGTKERTLTRLQDLKQIDELERKTAELKAALKKESQFNRKLELNVEIKNHQQAIARLQEQL
jgi:hypothetical protein